jgi:hypothetical protein
VPQNPQNPHKSYCGVRMPPRHCGTRIGPAPRSERNSCPIDLGIRRLLGLRVCGVFLPGVLRVLWAFSCDGSAGSEARDPPDWNLRPETAPSAPRTSRRDSICVRGLLFAGRLGVLFLVREPGALGLLSAPRAVPPQRGPIPSPSAVHAALDGAQAMLHRFRASNPRVRLGRTLPERGRLNYRTLEASGPRLWSARSPALATCREAAGPRHGSRANVAPGAALERRKTF